MPDLIAEAFVQIRPDLTGFAAQLQAGVLAAVRTARIPGIRVPITPVVVGAQGAVGALSSELAIAEEVLSGAGLSAARSQEVLNAALAAGGVELAGAQIAANALAVEEGVLAAAGEGAAETQILLGVAAGRTAEELAAAAVATEVTTDETIKAAAARLGLARAEAQEQAAKIAVARANAALVTSEERLAELQAIEGVEAKAVAEAETAVAAAREAADLATRRLAIATEALAIANARLAAGAGGRAAAGLGSVGTAGNAARGALIGLSRITPVTVFGLGAIGSAAIAAGLALTAAINSAVSFQQQLNVFRVVSGATASEMKAVSDAAIKLGADITLPAISAADAAEAMTELAKAGISVEDSLAASRGVLQLSAAAGIDAAEAAKIAATALNAFSLSGTQATHVADLLAAASIAAQGEITDMALALQQSAAVAHQANVSIDDTVTAISLLAKAGLQGSDAGTSLRTTLLRLVPTTKEAAQFVNALGVAFSDSSGQLRPLAGIFEQYRQALEPLPPVLRQAALAQIFGQDAIRAASIFTEAGAKGFRDMRREVELEGAAAEVAAARTSGAGGQFSALVSNLETLGVTLGQVTLGPLASFLQGLNEIVTDASNAITALQKFISSIDFPDISFKIGPIGFAQGEDGESVGERFAHKFAHAVELTLAPGITIPHDIFEHFNKGNKEAIENNQRFTETLLVARELAKEFDLPTERIDKKIASLRRQLQELTQPNLIPKGLSDEEALQRLDAIRNRLISQGKTTAVVDALLRDIRARIVSGLRDVAFETSQALPPILNQGVKGISKTIQTEIALIQTMGDSLPANARIAAVKSLRNLIEELAKLGPEGQAALQDIGKSLMQALGEGITDEEQNAIDAARRAVQEAVEAANDAFVDSVRSARSNLESLGDTVGSALGQIIDAGPLGRQIDAIEKQLDRLRDLTSIGDLRARQRQAQRALAEQQQAVATIGAPTASQKRIIAEIFDPLKTSVRDANSAVKEFRLEGKQKELEKTRDAAKKAAEEGVQRLVQQFEQGKISADEFARRLRNRLGPALADLKNKAGVNLGLRFTTDFLRNVDALVQQVQFLSGFLNVPGTTPGNQPTSPAKVRSDQAARVADARRNLEETIKNARKTADNTGEMSSTLREILAVIRATSRSSPGGARITPAESRAIRAARISTSISAGP